MEKDESWTQFWEPLGPQNGNTLGPKMGPTLGTQSGPQNGNQKRGPGAQKWPPFWVPKTDPKMGTKKGALQLDLIVGPLFWFPFWNPFLVPKTGFIFGPQGPFLASHFGVRVGYPKRVPFMGPKFEKGGCSVAVVQLLCCTGPTRQSNTPHQPGRDFRLLISRRGQGDGDVQEATRSPDLRALRKSFSRQAKGLYDSCRSCV